MNLTDAVAPRSDQMNAEDLLNGPRSFTITEVRIPGGEQPVQVFLAEFPADRPWKPSKTSLRVMMAAWGDDTAVWVGKGVTLWRDPEITFGRDKVGGIKISHLSGIDKPMTVWLTVTKGRRAPYVVEVLTAPVAPAPVEVPLPDRIGKAIAAFGRLNVSAEMLETKLGAPNEQWAEDDLTSLMALFTSISSGASTVEAEFAGPSPEAL